MHKTLYNILRGGHVPLLPMPAGADASDSVKCRSSISVIVSVYILITVMMTVTFLL